MGLTAQQFSKIKSHPNLEWLKRQHQLSRAVHQDIIRAKIKQAIESALPNSGTEENISDVARKIGIFYGNVVKPPVVPEGLVHPHAVSELEGTDAGLASAAKMIFQRTATGRTSPGTSGINHIHAGGNAHVNVLFDADTYVIYGVVHEHMEGGLSQAQKNVMARKNIGGAAVRMRVLGNTIMRA